MHDTTSPTVIGALRATSPTVRYLLLGAFINQLGYFIQAYLLVFMLHQGFSVIQAGWGLALLGGGAVLGTLIGATLGTRVGNRRAIMIATTAMGVSVALVPLLVQAHMPLMVWSASILVTGIFAQMYRPPAATILSQHLPESLRVMGFSMFRIAINLGGAAGPLVATLLAQFNWTLVFWLNAACSLAYTAIAAAKLPKDAPRGASQIEENTPRARHATWRHVLRDHRFLAFLAAMFLSSMVYMQIYSTLPVAIEARSLPLATYSTLLTVSALIVICAELKISLIMRRFPAWIPSTVGTTILCLGVASFGLTLGSNVLLIASMAFMVMGLMTSGPTMFAYPASFPEAIRGKYIGANQAAFSAGNALGPVAGVAVFREYHDAVWVLCLVLAIVSGALVLIGMRPDRGVPASGASAT